MSRVGRTVVNWIIPPASPAPDSDTAPRLCAPVDELLRVGERSTGASPLITSLSRTDRWRFGHRRGPVAVLCDNIFKARIKA